MKHRKIYNSFDEVEEDLKIFKLQKEIDKEKLILRYNKTKQDLEISPKKIIGEAVGNVMNNAAGSIARKALFMKILGKFIKRR